MSSEDIREYALEVRRLVGSGVLKQDIAKYLDISLDELNRDYSDILNRAAIDKTVEVANALYTLAVDGNLQACIFWLKNVGKWEELAEQKDDIQKNEVLTDINVSIGTKKEDFE